MTQNKRTPRKKAYKTMSVSELVACRKELALKIEQIDAVLNEAVEAISATGATRNLKTNYAVRSNSDPAFAERSTNINEVSITREAPTLPPISRTAADQSSGFSIFDAESAAKEQALAEEQYLASIGELKEEL